MRNQLEFKVYGKYALFSDPLTKLGGEKCSYHLPTYEALKGIAKSIYWKPTFIWVIDKVRIMKPIRTQTKNMKPLDFGGGNSLAIYTYLADVEYQVQMHFEWNLFRPDMARDRIDGKHYEVAERMIEKGGRQDIFLGVRDCQGYVVPDAFGNGAGHYDTAGELDYGLMFHGFDYPDETGKTDEDGNRSDVGKYRLHSRFWRPVMRNGVLEFPRPENCPVRKFVREMTPNPPKSEGLQDFTLAQELGSEVAP